jgi:hypothetical protein
LLRDKYSLREDEQPRRQWLKKRLVTNSLTFKSYIMRVANTKVVKSNTERAGFHSGQEFMRGVNDNFENSHHTNEQIKSGLSGELQESFELWKEVIITPPSEQDKIRYENFIMGYIYRHDMQDGEPDHLVYFKWDVRQGSLLGRVFVSPLMVARVSTLEPAPAESLVVDAAADATDPPDSTTPPPPLNGVSSST